MLVQQQKVVYRPVPNHRYAQYATETKQGQFWIHFACMHPLCRDRTDKPCSNPQRLNFWIIRYASLHLHRS